MTAHRHKNSAGKWVTVSDGLHAHPADAALTERVKKLEAQMVTILAQPVVVPVAPPLVISNVASSSITTSSAVVSWDLSAQGTGRVEYGTTLAYGSFTTKEESFNYSSHSQVVSGLADSTLYHYRVISTSRAGRTTTSGDFTFTTSAPPVAAYYGSGIAMDGLGNTRVGYGNQHTSYRFRAEQSSAVNSLLIYIIANGNTGYSNGTGGTLRARLRADDGTANHRPTGADLATASIAPGNPASGFQTLTFGAPYTVTAGTLYHIHWDNTDGSPTVNYLSLDAVWQENVVPTPVQPKWPDDLDWYQLFSDDNGSTWSNRNNATPIMDITYGNGSHQGVGYMEVSYGSGELGYLGGTSLMVREAFTVSGGNRTVTGVGVRFWRETGTADVSCRLETSAGTEIETVTIPYTAFSTETTPPPGSGGFGGPSDWTGAGSYGYVAFASSHVVTNGASYNIRFSCAAGSTFGTMVMRRGSAQGFNAATYFADGVSQKTTDGTNWSSLGRVANVNNLPIYFTV